MLFVVTFNDRITQLSRNMTNVMEASTNLRESQAFVDFLNVSYNTSIKDLFLILK